MLDKACFTGKHNSRLSQGSLLDIGTGTGYFPHFMQERGWHVSAIEKSPQARQFAKEHFELGQNLMKPS
jgi:2-polyprenyl-3-methyl-5-hydroxy-6-metoxy-1,4-benzoquinol methylase